MLSLSSFTPLSLPSTTLLHSPCVSHYCSAHCPRMSVILVILDTVCHSPSHLFFFSHLHTLLSVSPKIHRLPLPSLALSTVDKIDLLSFLCIPSLVILCLYPPLCMPLLVQCCDTLTSCPPYSLPALPYCMHVYPSSLSCFPSPHFKLRHLSSSPSSVFVRNLTFVYPHVHSSDHY
jgi:hypothetical protein